MAPDPGWAGFLFPVGPVRVRSEAFSFPSPDDPEGAFVPPEFDVTGNTFEVGGSSRAPPSPGCRARPTRGRLVCLCAGHGLGVGGRLRSTPLCQSQGPRRQLGIWTRSSLSSNAFPACELAYVEQVGRARSCQWRRAGIAACGGAFPTVSLRAEVITPGHPVCRPGSAAGGAQSGPCRGARSLRGTEKNSVANGSLQTQKS